MVISADETNISQLHTWCANEKCSLSRMVQLMEEYIPLCSTIIFTVHFITTSSSVLYVCANQRSIFHSVWYTIGIYFYTYASNREEVYRFALFDVSEPSGTWNVLYFEYFQPNRKFSQIVSWVSCSKVQMKLQLTHSIRRSSMTSRSRALDMKVPAIQCLLSLR